MRIPMTLDRWDTKGDVAFVKDSAKGDVTRIRHTSAVLKAVDFAAHPV